MSNSAISLTFTYFIHFLTVYLLSVFCLVCVQGNSDNTILDQANDNFEEYDDYSDEDDWDDDDWDDDDNDRDYDGDYSEYDDDDDDDDDDGSGSGGNTLLKHV